jgi:hypothetical protein
MDASSMTCPKCGWARELNALDCPACGIVYARYGAAPRRAASSEGTAASAPPPPPRASSAANPYAPPRSDVQAVVETPVGQVYGGAGETAGVWRAGDILVMQKGASLPVRCLLCNQPAAVQLPKKMHWHHPALYVLLFLGGPVIYLIVAMVTRKTANMVLPLCAAHVEKKKKMTVTASLLALSGLALSLGSCAFDEQGNVFPFMILLGFLLMIIGGLVSISVTNMIIPKKIDDYYVWLKKISTSYLATLPQAPPGL